MMVDGETELTFAGIGKYEIRILATFPTVPGVILDKVLLKEGDRSIVLKMTGDLEAVVMLEEKEESLAKLRI